MNEIDWLKFKADMRLAAFLVLFFMMMPLIVAYILVEKKEKAEGSK